MLKEHLAANERLHWSFMCLQQYARVIYWHVYNDVITPLSQFMSIFTVPLTASWKETRIKTVVKWIHY